MNYLLVLSIGTVTVSAAFIPTAKEILRRNSADDMSSRRHNIDNRIHASGESDLEARHLSEDSNTPGTSGGSLGSNFKKKINNSTISGKLVIVISDSGVGLSKINLKRLFKEVLSLIPLILTNLICV
jgi:hypothetical protein